jgi:hypothetical protein
MSYQKSRTCPKCGVGHLNKGMFCSRKCANSRTFTEESRRKKSEANKKQWNALTEDEKRKKCELLTHYSPYASKNYLPALMTQEWDTLGLQARRLRVIVEQNGTCNRCKLSHWQDELITFEYEHKDGNNGNNSRENVEALCPNCHSLTATWRGRKNKNSTRQERVKRLLTKMPNISS